MTAAAGGTRGHAVFGGRHWEHAVESVDVAAHPERLSAGSWVVVATFEGVITAWRFESSRPLPDVPSAGSTPSSDWRGPHPDAWVSDMTRAEYCDAVTRVREHIREGDVYQVNICRILSAPLSGPAAGPEPDAAALARVLAAGNPAPHAGYIHVPHGLTTAEGVPIAPVWVVSASPELFVRVTAAGTISSSPIKGTAATPDGLGEKDRAENVMIVDLVRNDFQRVSVPGSIRVDPLLQVQHHPGLVHLVSTVHGSLADPEGPDLWGRIFARTFPPGSVSGAPKSSALRIISALEASPRGPYCGAVGWIDAEARQAELAVGIRTFVWDQNSSGQGTLRFGTGAGITWDSDPAAEWEETELKARRLVSLASRPSLTSRPRPALGEDTATAPPASPALWIDGDRPAAPETIHVADHGFLLGDGVFETFLVRDGRVQALGAHLTRLRVSCDRLGIAVPYDDATLAAVARDLAREASAGQEDGIARVRLTVTSGPGPAGLRRGSGPATVAISASPFAPSSEPVSAVVVPWPRNEDSAIAGIKSTSMAENIMAARYAHARGADEGLWLTTRGHLCEGATSNVFLDLGDRLVTPPLSTGALPGVARGCVLARSRERGIAVAEDSVGSDLIARLRAGEAGLFLTSAARGIVPVISLDGVALRVGALTQRAQRALAWFDPLAG